LSFVIYGKLFREVAISIQVEGVGWKPGGASDVDGRRAFLQAEVAEVVIGVAPVSIGTGGRHADEQGIGVDIVVPCIAAFHDGVANQ
jgi:hypothetical protein